jgi:hypothetical protein
MTVSRLSQELTDDWSSAAVMETDHGLQGRVATAGHLTRNSRSGSGRETRPGRGREVGDGSRPSQTPTVPTSSPSCTYSTSCRVLSPQDLTDRPRLRREDRSGGQAARNGQAREVAASDADVAGKCWSAYRLPTGDPASKPNSNTSVNWHCCPTWHGQERIQRHPKSS